MNRLPIIIVGTIAITAGCSSGQNGTPTPTGSTTSAKPSHAEPVTPNAKAKLAELIPSTDRSHRLEVLQQGRLDPFTRLATRPVEQLPVVSPAQVKAQIPLPPPPPSETPLVPTSKPEVPQADVARKIAVLGVIQIGKVSYAIIKQPQDATTRYVAEGQILSNSGILVKKIGIGSDFGTQVVFEENGVEISKAVDGVEVATAKIEPEPIISRQDVGAQLVATNNVSPSSISSLTPPYSIEHVRSSGAPQREASPRVNRSEQRTKKSSVVLRVPPPPSQLANFGTGKTKRSTVKIRWRSTLIAAKNPSPPISQNNPVPKPSVETQQRSVVNQKSTEPFLVMRSPAQPEAKSNRDTKRQQLLSQLRSSILSANNSLASASSTGEMRSLKQQQLIFQLRGNSSKDSSFNAE